MPHLIPTLAVFGSLDWAIVGVYFAVVIAVGFIVSHHDSGEKEFFLGNRNMPTWAVAISLVATMLSAVTFVGVPDIAYKGNLTYLILNLGGILAVFIVAFFFIPTLYRAGTVTIYGFLAQRFGENARLAVSCAFIFGRMLASAARLFTAAIPLSVLLFGFDKSGIPFWQIATSVALIGVIGTIYATAGGVRAIVWVDTIQFTIVLGTALLTIGILLHRLAMPLPEIVSALEHPATGPSKLQVLDLSLDPTREFTLWTALLGNTFLMTAALGVDHDLAQRFLITRSALRGGISVISSQFIGMMVVSLFLVIGLLLYLYNQRHPSPAFEGTDLAMYPRFLINELPTGLAGVSIVGFFAIAQGSLDSAMNALAASIVSDVYVPLRRAFAPADGAAPGAPARAPKVAVAAVGMGMTLIAVLCAAAFGKKSSILNFVLSLMSFAYSGMLGVFVTALFTRRGNNTSVIAALFTGLGVSVLLFDPVLPAWSRVLLGHELKLAWTWAMPLATMAAFLVCAAGRREVKPEATAPETPASPP